MVGSLGVVAETSTSGRYTVVTEKCTLGDVGATVHLDPSPAVTALVTSGHLKAEAAAKSTREAKPETEER